MENQTNVVVKFNGYFLSLDDYSINNYTLRLKRELGPGTLSITIPQPRNVYTSVSPPPSIFKKKQKQFYLKFNKDAYKAK